MDASVFYKSMKGILRLSESCTKVGESARAQGIEAMKKVKNDWMILKLKDKKLL